MQNSLTDEKERTTKILDNLLEDICQRHFQHTLEQKYSDREDFFEVSVWRLKKALVDAFIKGIHCGKIVNNND